MYCERPRGSYLCLSTQGSSAHTFTEYPFVSILTLIEWLSNHEPALYSKKELTKMSFHTIFPKNKYINKQIHNTFYFFPNLDFFFFNWNNALTPLPGSRRVLL